MEVLSLNNLKSLPEDRFASTCSQNYERCAHGAAGASRRRFPLVY